METFTPWITYPPLTEKRLRHVAGLVKACRDEVVALHDPDSGDDSWSLGCRAYSRTRHALGKESAALPWLTVVPELSPLRFTFAIGGVPIRFYRGTADEPPNHYSSATDGEKRQMELFKLDFQWSGILRLAINTDAHGDVVDITLVEVDVNGHAVAVHEILRRADVTEFKKRPEGVELPPPQIEPLDREESDRGDISNQG